MNYELSLPRSCNFLRNFTNSLQTTTTTEALWETFKGKKYTIWRSRNHPLISLLKITLKWNTLIGSLRKAPVFLRTFPASWKCKAMQKPDIRICVCSEYCHLKKFRYYLIMTTQGKYLIIYLFVDCILFTDCILLVRCILFTW